MAEQKQVTPPFELEKTLLIDNQEYNVNAVHATQVDSNLTIKQINMTNTTSTVFNGSRAINVSVVPSSGGRFSGPICATSALNITEPGGKIKNDAILNYGDFNNVILKSLINNSILYNWNAVELLPSRTSEETISGISLVTGREQELNNTTNGFAKANYNNKWLPAYLYICSDTKNIYFGTESLATASRLAISTEISNKLGDAKLNFQASDIKKIKEDITKITDRINNLVTASDSNVIGVAALANMANKLSEERTLAVTLDKEDKPLFDGSTDVTMGVNGILPIAKGGTGSTTSTGAIANIINGQTIKPSLISDCLIQISANQSSANATVSGINMNNSDIIGINGMYFNNRSDVHGEGLNFTRTDSSTHTHWDRLYALDGNLYFKPNTTNTDRDEATANVIWHTGNATSEAYERRRKIDFCSASDYPNGISNSIGSNGDIIILY